MNKFAKEYDKLYEMHAGKSPNTAKARAAEEFKDLMDGDPTAFYIEPGPGPNQFTFNHYLFNHSKKPVGVVIEVLGFSDDAEEEEEKKMSDTDIAVDISDDDPRVQRQVKNIKTNTSAMLKRTDDVLNKLKNKQSSSL